MIKGFSETSTVSVGDLAKLLVIRHHTAAELIDRLVKLRLLTKTIDGVDSRRVVTSLTRNGEGKLQQLSRIHSEELRATAPALVRTLRLFRQP